MTAVAVVTKILTTIKSCFMRIREWNLANSCLYPNQFEDDRQTAKQARCPQQKESFAALHIIYRRHKLSKNNMIPQLGHECVSVHK